ncbi:hypothetical protein CAOG_03306 [Capsaspora owczarzaki ATCC 30864]|uniref:hypothetical protein n=1 Tax=Capsaspora owczarzaki (strain ATCC 30864) TaxID=595528 RepID=UPI0003523D5D|nr:hypothetical protein CAOG_03306 [Capsaspora owczarzaki ATCC 30864]|eukprot:XP_004364145.2 hypothetical protein CAOG_03306 [Capsaspora owczarzaki ATCC 30864]
MEETDRLGSNRIGDGGAWAIAEALKVNTTLTWFYLDSNQIGDAGAQAIAEALKDKPLAELKLGGNRIGDAGARAIAEALKVNKTLTQLEFGDNPIGDVGAQAVAEALTVNKTLTRLSLWSSQIGDAGARAIAEALKVNKTLTQLDLGDNQIGDVGAQAVAEALKVNKTLTRLSLSCNRIGDAGAVAIAEALTVNKTLTELYLTYNCISVLGSEAIYRACTGKRRLQAFHGSRVNPLAFSLLPRLASAEDIQEVLGVLTSGLELENQRISLPALPTEIAELIMDKAHCWQGMQNTKREYFHIEDRRVPKVTVPQGNSIRVKAIQVLRDWRSRPDNTDDCAFDLTVRDEQGAVRYECAVHPTFVDSNLTHATICRASHPIVRQMREGWQVQIRASEFGRDVTFESLYVGFGLHE